jgi:hypothetical protein
MAQVGRVESAPEKGDTQAATELLVHVFMVI